MCLKRILFNSNETVFTNKYPWSNIEVSAKINKDIFFYYNNDNYSNDKIKSKNIQEEISKEYRILKEAQDSSIKTTEKIKQLFRKIKEVNLNLWDIENEIRIYEKKKDFGKKFTELSRSVYFNNDKRAKIKSEINEILGSNIKEIKQYADY